MPNPSRNALLHAVREGDVDKVSALTATHALSYFDASSGGYNLLREALKRNHTKIAKILLEHGSRVNRDAEYSSNTALHFAIENKNAEIVVMLLDRNANVDFRNYSGDTPLHLSIKEKNLKIISLLLNKNADVNIENNIGETPLSRAIVEGNVEIVDLLWRNNVRTHARSSKGKDVLHIAAEAGITKIVEDLLNNGAFVDIACDENGYTPLHCACAKNREEIVELLLKRGADINARTKNQSTALHLVAELKFDKIIKVLLGHDGVDIDAEDDRGKTLLNVAVERGHLPTIENILAICPQLNNEKNRHIIRDYLYAPVYEGCRLPIVKSLLSHSFGVHPEDANDKKLLHIAIAEGCTKIVEDLLRYGAHVDSPDEEKKGSTLLHNAAINGWHDIAETLIKHGANVNATDETGKSPISYAIEKIDAKMTKLLVSSGAEIKFDPYVLGFVHCSDAKEITEIMLNHDVDYDIMGKNIKGRTLLWSVVKSLAASRDSTIRRFDRKREDQFRAERDFVELLLSRGAEANEETNNEKSILHLAVRKDRDDIVEVLLRYNADVNFVTKYDVATPLHYSAANRNGLISRMLLNAGAAINAKNASGKTALHCACENESRTEYSEKIVDTLLEFGAEIDHRDFNECTPLHYSVAKGNEHVSRKLLNAGAASNAENKTGKTPLHYACKHDSNKKIVDTLLEFGAEIDHKDSSDCTPLHIAAGHGCWRIVKTLLKSFAEVEYRDKGGNTALHVALKCKWPRVVKVLLDYGADLIVTCKKSHSTVDYATIGLYNYNYQVAQDFHFKYEKFNCDEDYEYRFNYRHKEYSDSDQENYHDISDEDVNLGSDNGRPGRIADMIREYIIKIKLLNIEDSERNLDYVEHNDELEDFQAECEREVELMKSEKIGDTNISYYYLLMQSINQLAMFARNKDIVEILQSSRYREKFPIYCKMFYYKFNKGQKRGNLLNPSFKSFNFLSSFSVPELVSFKVLDKLSNKDLEHLIKAVPENESQ